MQFTNFILLLTAMATSVAAMPVTTDAADVDTSAPDANINYNLQPNCPDDKTYTLCIMGNVHPRCVGTKFSCDLGDQCKSCYCE
ncbi:hypothetical protein GE09DRAFT_1085966 [Coniochaeta sp. 2T2.1]|nr:hypothetical protein GE09DRAFT_1085966 [Coniochaeta sp. 2T2.1]